MHHPLLSAYFKFFDESTVLVAYPVRGVLICLVTFSRRIIKNGLRLIEFSQTRFKATVKRDAETRLEKSSAHYWFKSWDQILPQVASTVPKHRNVRNLKSFLIHDATTFLLALLYAIERTLF